MFQIRGLTAQKALSLTDSFTVSTTGWSLSAERSSHVVYTVSDGFVDQLEYRTKYVLKPLSYI